MPVSFYRGQQLGRQDLNIFLHNQANTPTNAYDIYYTIIDFTTYQDAIVGPPKRVPENPTQGEYYAAFVVPLDANLGNYKLKWTFQEFAGSPVRQVVQEFEVTEKGCSSALVYTPIETDLIRRMRILLRDNDPDRNYHFRPPARETTVKQFNSVFGFIWEDYELKEFLETALGMVIAAPPRTPFQSVDQMIQFRSEWSTLLLTGAMQWALNALRINWIQEEFSYSIGGISLDLERSSKYESAAQFHSDQFDKQLEKAKLTVNYIRGLQQPRFGMGVRSAFGPYTGAGVLSPRKFIGF
jgi:hypothetical protein